MPVAIVACLQVVNWGRVGSIAASWFVSPMLGMVISFAMYYVVHKYVILQPYVARAPARALSVAVV